MSENLYSNLSKEELLVVISKLESRKKYGLIWDLEKTQELFEKDAQNAFPILKEVKSKNICIQSNSKTNIFIEGDNYHALSVLNFSHQDKIGCIYIDPPYNTGEKDFIYNDHFIDETDEYRHSKWLSFMYKRLRLAKNLLTPEGVMFISIGNNELAQLKLLLDTYIFDESNCLGILTWVNKTKPVNSGKGRYQIQQNIEYVLCYSKTRKSDFPGFSLVAKGERTYNHTDVFGEYRLIDIEDSDKGRKKRDSMKFTILGIAPGEGKRWKIGKIEAERLIKDKRLVKVRGKIKKKIYSTEENLGIERPFWSHLSNDVGTAESGKSDLSNVLGKDHGFDTVKPKELIMELLSHLPKDATVLDFFAGSGTTAQAVYDLNILDGGERSFIICTNNESKIAENICYPRIKKAVKTNLRYFRTNFIKISLSRDELRIKLTKECAEMLCLREGTFEEVVDTFDYKVFENNAKVVGIYFSLDRDNLLELKKYVDNSIKEKVLYCFTLDPIGLDKTDFADWKDIRLEPVPQKILEIYKQIYEY